MQALVSGRSAIRRRSMPARELPAYPFRVFLTISQMMSTWREDLSTCTLEEVLRSQVENRAWSRELRQKASSLVNSRLAKEVSRDDYLARRKVADQEATECRRRATMLHAQICSKIGSPAGGN